jgi:LysR family hca operon transcriptional activator
MELVASTGGVMLMPLYAPNFMPNSVVSRPIRGAPPMIDLVLGYSEANTSPVLKFLLSKVEDLKFRVSALQSKQAGCGFPGNRGPPDGNHSETL